MSERIMPGPFKNLTPEEFSERIKEGQRKSAKQRANLERKAKGPWSREARRLRTTFAKGKSLSMWEKICGADHAQG